MATKDSDDENCCFFEVSIAGSPHPPHRMVMQLFRETCPNTCQNFAALCASPGRTTPSRPLATYRGSIFHRVVPQFMVQGGDFEHFNGTGGYSVLNTSARTFADESFAISHDKAGILSMANKGKNTNGSQFFITLQPTPHLNQKHVVFGQVVEGMSAVHSMATDVELEGTKPTAMQKIIIVDCGVGRGPNSGEKRSDDSEIESNSDRRRHSKHSKDEKKRKSKEKRKSHKAKRKRKHSKERHGKRKEYDSDSDDSSHDSLSTTSSTAGSRRKDRKQRRHHKGDHKERKRSHSSSKRRLDDRSCSVSSSDSRKRSHKHHR